jgi:hypothetical protein
VLTIDEKLQRYNDIQMEFDKRQQIVGHFIHDYPAIVEQITPSIEQLQATIDRLRTIASQRQQVDTR